ncbi:hypothetical protein [Marivita sp. GX14005]|uniref:hypothetical protein n=1 Tax=Marivita sp. GX14005 TaxID=2942276 RepID=UPI002018FA84|nr:hypothetical protein [Marivita sp. GX14005]MCL3881751.1 hypothetical protein [Marivita sp. GX14005]
MFRGFFIILATLAVSLLLYAIFGGSILLWLLGGWVLSGPIVIADAAYRTYGAKRAARKSAEYDAAKAQRVSID